MIDPARFRGLTLGVFCVGDRYEHSTRGWGTVEAARKLRDGWLIGLRLDAPFRCLDCQPSHDEDCMVRRIDVAVVL